MASKGGAAVRAPNAFSGEEFFKLFREALKAETSEERQAKLKTLEAHETKSYLNIMDPTSYPNERFGRGIIMVGDVWTESRTKTDYRTALEIAMDERCFEAVKWLLEKGTTLSLKDRFTSNDAVKLLEKLIDHPVSASDAKANGAGAGESPVAHPPSEYIDLIVRNLIQTQASNLSLAGERFVPLIKAAAMKKNIPAAMQLLTLLPLSSQQKRTCATECLIVAGEQQNIDAIKFFVGLGADMEIKDNFGASSLIRASTQTNPEALSVMRCLLEHKASPEATAWEHKVHGGSGTVKKTSLMLAIEEGNKEKVALLLEFKADVNATDQCVCKNEKDPRAVIHYAVARGNHDVIKLVLDAKPTVGINQSTLHWQGGSPELPIARIIEMGDLGLVRQAVALGMDLQQVPNALHSALKNASGELVTYLLAEQKMPVDTQDKDGATPLMAAAALRNFAAASALLEHKANPNLTQPANHMSGYVAGRNVFHLVALHWQQQSDEKALEQLCSVPDADLNAADDKGLTPLMLAATQGNAPVAKCLIKHLRARGLSVNVQAKDGSTAAYCAAAHYKPQVTDEILEALHQAGANFNLRAGKSPAEVATHPEVAARLRGWEDKRDPDTLLRENVHLVDENARLRQELAALQAQLAKTVESKQEGVAAAAAVPVRVAPNGFDGSGPFVSAAAPAAENQRPLPAAAALPVDAPAGAVSADVDANVAAVAVPALPAAALA